VHSAAVASLTVTISKINKEKHVLHFRLSRQKHAKAQVGPKQIKTVSEHKKFPGRGGEEKFMLCPPHPPHFLATSLNKWMDRWMDGRTGGRTDGRTDGWMDGWMDG